MAEQRPSGGGETRDDPGSTSAKVRGCVITARLAYVAKRWTNDHKNAILGRFGASERRRLESVAADGDWFDYPILETIETCIVDELAHGDRSVLRHLGSACADHNLKRILAIRTAGLGPEHVLQRLCRMPLLDNFGEGEFEMVEVPGKLGATLTFNYPPAVTDMYVEGAVGFYGRLLERLGATEIDVTVVPVTERGPNARRYVLRWETAGVDEASGAGEGPGVLTETEMSGGRSPEAPASLAASSQGNASASREPGRGAEAARRATPGAVPATSATATAHTGRPAKADKATSALSARAKVVIGVVVIVVLAIVGEWAYFSGVFEPSYRSDLGGHRFTKSGDLEVAVAFGDVHLLVESGAQLTNVTVNMQQSSKMFTATYPVLPRSALWQVDMSQLRASDGSHPVHGEMPTKVVVEATANGETKVAEFRP